MERQREEGLGKPQKNGNLKNMMACTICTWAYKYTKLFFSFHAHVLVTDYLYA